MGTLFTRLLALAVLIVVPSYASAHVEINIDLTSQTMTVYSGSGETYVWPISSGRGGHATPNGVFRPRALYAMVQRQGAEIRIVGSPFSDIAHRERRSESALGFAPVHHTSTLKEWARNPLAQ